MYWLSTSLRTGLRCCKTIYSKFSIKLDGAVKTDVGSHDWDSQDKHDEPFPLALGLLSAAFSVVTLQTLCSNTLTLCLEEHDKWLDMWHSFHWKDSVILLAFCVVTQWSEHLPKKVEMSSFCHPKRPSHSNERSLPTKL